MMISAMAPPAEQLTVALTSTLVANLGAFQGFARKRLNNDELAAAAVQESLYRALKVKKSLTDDKNLLAWFYRILRNVLTDLHRRGATRSAALQRFAHEEPNGQEEGKELHDAVCGCFKSLLPTLSPEYTGVLQAVDLDGLTSTEAADRLGITRGNLKVRLHRARRQLRERLKQTCKICATHGCLHCTCAS